MTLLSFHPLCQSRVWGGRALAEKLCRQLPADGPIDESWEIVDRPESQSVDTNSGKTLRQLLDIMGPDYNPARP